MGGTNGSSGTVEAYTPSTNTWTTVANMPEPRTGMAAATGTDGRIYAIGGESAPMVRVYTPGTNTWTILPGLSKHEDVGRSGLAATAASGRIYAIGGMAWEVDDYGTVLGRAPLGTVEALTP